MAELDEAEQASKIVEIFDYPEDREVRIALMRALLFIPKSTAFRVSAQNHGVMKSIGIYENEECCFSIAAAKQWAKVWVRKPELRKRPLSAQKFWDLFDSAEKNSSGELTARLYNCQDMEAFLGFLRSSAGR